MVDSAVGFIVTCPLGDGAGVLSQVIDSQPGLGGFRRSASVSLLSSESEKWVPTVAALSLGQPGFQGLAFLGCVIRTLFLL